MRTADASNSGTSTSQIYWNMLKNLNSEVKLELISKLSASLLNTHKTTDNVHWTASLAGQWKDNCSADEIWKDIRDARTSNSEVEL